jgi:hypothetical protein
MGFSKLVFSQIRHMICCGNTEIEKVKKNNPIQDCCLDFLFEF